MSLKKIPRGSLTPKHVVAIVGLVLTLYCVLPTGSAPAPADSATNVPASATPATPATSGSTTTPQPQLASTASTASLPGKQSSTAPGSLSTGIMENSAAVAVAPVDRTQLQNMIASNLFVVRAELRSSSEQNDSGLSSHLPGTVDDESATDQAAQSRKLPDGANHISVIYKSSRGTAAAVVDGQVLRHGAHLNDDWQVEHIGTKSVELRYSGNDASSESQQRQSSATIIELPEISADPLQMSAPRGGQHMQRIPGELSPHTNGNSDPAHAGSAATVQPDLSGTTKADDPIVPQLPLRTLTLP